MAVHIALHEVGARFEARAIRFTQRDHDPPEFRALNPEGKVPVLLMDGRALTEVAAILYYLARRYKEANLLASGDIEAEARVISWMSFIASSLHPARRQGVDHARAIYRLADQRLADQRLADQRLGGQGSGGQRLGDQGSGGQRGGGQPSDDRGWAVGGAYSIADIHLFRLFWRFRGSLGADPAMYPNLSAHHDRMMERPAVRKTLEAESALGYDLPA